MVTTIDQKIAEFFNNNFSNNPLPEGAWSWGNLLLCVISIILCAFLCGVIGLERESRGRSAGLRTHLLVGVGSCAVMIVSIYGFPALFSEHRDVARLAAQVITGVGFLGAGAIIHHNGGIKGLTTASTIWLVMAIGLCCGSMNFILAIGVTIIVMIVLIVFRKLEQKVVHTSPTFVLVCPSEVPFASIILEVSKKYNCQLLDLRTEMIKNGNKDCIEVTFKLLNENNKQFDIDAINVELTKRTKAISSTILNHH